MQSHCIRRFFSINIASNYHEEAREKFTLIIAEQNIVFIPVFVSWFLLVCQKSHFEGSLRRFGICCVKITIQN